MNPAASLDHSEPLVSVICFCKNRVSFMPRSIESVLNQTYKNIEFVVQDGASTDGTLELLRSYAARDKRLKIVSEADSGPAEAYWKVLHRCTGEYIATCLSDEELVPTAVEQAVAWFAQSPDAGAITCDGNTTDSSGKIIGTFKAGEFDFVAYLFGKYCPFWPGSFFRRQALVDVGFERPGWNIGCLEFEIWCRFARDHAVRYIPEAVSNYAIHPGQLSNTPANFLEHVENRLKLIEDMFSPQGFFGAGKFRERQSRPDANDTYGVDWFNEIEAKINQLSQFEFHARAHKLSEYEKKFGERIDILKKSLFQLHEHNLNIHMWEARKQNTSAHRQQWIDRLWEAWETSIGMPRFARGTRLSIRLRLWLVRALMNQVWIRFHLYQPLHYMLSVAQKIGLAETARSEFPEYAESLREMRTAAMYDTAARIYESRGQIGEALRMWRGAEPLNDSTVDSLACQASLKDPNATYESIAQLQQRWVDRHIRRDSAETTLPIQAFQGRKIRIGYHCSFMDADAIRYIMRRAIQSHDRSRFEVFGYAPMDLPKDMHAIFDVVRKSGGLSDQDFIALVRRDQVDVFIELSGFSPGHRFGAMAFRCARVQVSYLNHFATSRVPNVDYILSDDICTPVDSEAQRSFTETIHRLPYCLLCYDYTDDSAPPIGAPPSLSTKIVTFGCFGSGGKINTVQIGQWARLMHRVPSSQMLIQNHQLEPPDNRRYMIDRFRRFGIAADRLILRPGTDRLGVLRAYREVDISLDTSPYCGGNTVAESLWQGVPVVTLKGDRLSGRYGASLLQAARCGGFVANSADEYVEIAARLAQDPERLQYLRNNLRQMYTEGGLNDSARFARNLERAYIQMLEA